MTTDSAHRQETVSLLRFDVVQRVAHWLSAVLFVLLVLTGISLYFGSLFGADLPRFGVEQVHLWCGLAFPVPLVTSVLGRWGRQMRSDLKRVNYWTRGEIAWLRSFGRSSLDADKFNPAQKVHAVLVASSMTVMLFTGVVLKWFSLFPLSWRGGSTFVHDVGAWALTVLICGHVVMALAHPEALRSMVSGRVSERWADEHASHWLREETVGNDESGV